MCLKDCRDALPDFRTNEHGLAASPIPIPRIVVTPNIGHVLAYVDLDPKVFELLKIENQDDVNRFWIGYRFTESNGKYYIAENAALLQVPYDNVVFQNIIINADRTLSKTSFKSIKRAIDNGIVIHTEVTSTLSDNDN